LRGTYLLLASLKYVTVVQEEGLHLVDAPGSHEDEVEDSKDTQLEIKRAVSDHPEGEAAEQSSEDMKIDLVPDVVLQQLLLAFQPGVFSFTGLLTGDRHNCIISRCRTILNWNQIGEAYSEAASVPSSFEAALCCFRDLSLSSAC
jgi:hypothetical protein